MDGDDPLEAADLDAEFAPDAEVGGGSGRSPGLPPETFYGSVDEWLRKYWRFSFRRRVSAKGTGTGRWRADWWNVDEAVQRLEALWRSWEVARLDPGVGVSVWWINHAGPHMAVLLSIDGPFAGSTDENITGTPLPYTDPPKGLFPPDLQPATYT